ncbi:hypothetical protein KY346_00405 [Candidatus Woesearchaeota archaeon]|nr:hypothetical protein [Candidatus Woesearchaeota archaeon]
MESIAAEDNKEFSKALQRDSEKMSDEEWQEYALKGLEKLYGTAKLKKNRLSKKEWFARFLKKKPSEIFRKYGL